MYSRQAKEAFFQKPQANFLFLIIMRDRYLEEMGKPSKRSPRGTRMLTAAFECLMEDASFFCSLQPEVERLVRGKKRLPLPFH
mmetsp:Transcript_6848/g.6059  ORF Transcript_6848/g.6059 Transcript_6848/m.6059 type:complete len:83 (-) Transcript_6848:30-278(-)